MGKGDKDALLRMAHTLRHRGPDDSGVWQGEEVGFAHTRLAIVDLSSTGHQPMKSAHATLTFNGEIFNYKKLREPLAESGYQFKGTSDTEVILALYEAHGVDAFAMLEGQFAFALYDERTHALYLVRDRMGEKPLYWSEYEHTLVFGSELKAVFAHGLIPKALNKKVVAEYLTFDAVPAPSSIFEYVYKLPPASYLSYVDGNISIQPYWQPPQIIEEDTTEEEAKEKLDELFSQSVASQMVADVPVGIFLSGGLDSSLIAYYAQQHSAEKVLTFSLGFSERSFDESSHARRVAEFLGTEHYERIVSPEEIRGALLEVVKQLDEPIADPAILPNYLLSSFAREKVKVVLGGDGGDELFAGYQTFAAEKMLLWYRQLPNALRRYVIEPLVRHLPVSHKYFSFDFKAKQFIRGSHMPPQYVHQAWLESFNEKEREEILTPSMRLVATRPYDVVDNCLSEVREAPHDLQTAYFYLRTYMQDDILAKVDRASMMHSLEVRAPFLDKNIAEYALTLPQRLKMRGLTGKYILKELMKGRLPKEILARKKHGFGLPVGIWFMHEWKDFLQEVLSPEHVGRVGVCDPEVVTRLVEEHQSGVRNHRKKLWSLLVFHLWYDTWIA